MKEIVKYNNQINQLSFKNFSDYDLNFLMVICAKMRDLGEETQRFTYSQLMDLLQWDRSKSIEVFHKDLKRMAERLRHVGATMDIDDDIFTAFNLFSDFEGNKKKRELIVTLNPRFKYGLNDLTKNFTRFELQEYIHLSGRYSKLLYQHLKQFRTQGWWQVSLEEIRYVLAIPASMPTMNIRPKVINPSIETICNCCKGFTDLSVEVLRSERRGRAVVGYKFTWTLEQIKRQVPGQIHIDDLPSAEQEKKKRQQSKKNSFNSFPQNQYNFEQLEEDLLSN